MACHHSLDRDFAQNPPDTCRMVIMGMGEKNIIQLPDAIMQEIGHIHHPPNIISPFPDTAGIHHKGMAVGRNHQRGIPLPHIDEMHLQLPGTARFPATYENQQYQHQHRYFLFIRKSPIPPLIRQIQHNQLNKPSSCLSPAI